MPIYKKPTKKRLTAPDYQGFPCDGLWMVQTLPNSRSFFNIDQISEIPKPYPFAQMVVSVQSLVDFLGDFEKRAQEKTGTYKELPSGKKTLVSWAAPSRFDTAMAILRWMSQQVVDDRSIGRKSFDDQSESFNSLDDFRNRSRS